jgi:hypothetical protein
LGNQQKLRGLSKAQQGFPFAPLVYVFQFRTSADQELFEVDAFMDLFEDSRTPSWRNVAWMSRYAALRRQSNTNVMQEVSSVPHHGSHGSLAISTSVSMKVSEQDLRVMTTADPSAMIFTLISSLVCNTWQVLAETHLIVAPTSSNLALLPASRYKQRYWSILCPSCSPQSVWAQAIPSNSSASARFSKI